MADAGRVVGGIAKGTRLLAPGTGTRPLADRVKQSLFSALVAEDAVGEGTAFLDLFAGGGGAGIEALSLGARRAVFVEKDRRACEVIAANLARSGVPGGIVVRSDVLRFLRAGGAGAGTGAPTGDLPAFDAVLIDPPYGEPLIVPTLEILGTVEGGWLATKAVVVAKHFWRDQTAARVGLLSRYRERRFGETMLSFYRLGQAEGER